MKLAFSYHGTTFHYEHAPEATRVWVSFHVPALCETSDYDNLESLDQCIKRFSANTFEHVHGVSFLLNIENFIEHKLAIRHLNRVPILNIIADINSNEEIVNMVQNIARDDNYYSCLIFPGYWGSYCCSGAQF